MKKYIVDRIENGFAVCEDEDGQMVDISLENLPSDLKQGDVLILEQEKYEVLKEETEKIKKEMFDLQNSLFN